MSFARPAIVILILLVVLAMTPSAQAVLSPLLSQGAFIFTGWHFGYSAFGTGHF